MNINYLLPFTIPYLNKVLKLFIANYIIKLYLMCYKIMFKHEFDGKFIQTRVTLKVYFDSEISSDILPIVDFHINYIFI